MIPLRESCLVYAHEHLWICTTMRQNDWWEITVDRCCLKMWLVTDDIWQEVNDKWQVSLYRENLTYDIWEMTFYKSHVTVHFIYYYWHKFHLKDDRWDLTGTRLMTLMMPWAILRWHLTDSSDMWHLINDIWKLTSHSSQDRSDVKFDMWLRNHLVLLYKRNVKVYCLRHSISFLTIHLSHSHRKMRKNFTSVRRPQT